MSARRCPPPQPDPGARPGGDPVTAEPERPSASGHDLWRARLLSNSGLGLVAYVVYLPVGFFLARFTVHGIGLKAFGTWAALTTLLGYGGLLDLGMAAPLEKFTAAAIARGENSDVNVLLSTAMVVYCAVGVAFVGVMLAASGWILENIFHEASNPAIFDLYVTMLVGFACCFCFNVLTSLLLGLQQARVNSLINLASSLCAAAAAISAILLGLGLTGLVVSWVTVNVLTVAATWLVAKRLFPELRLNPLLFRRPALAHIFRFSARVQITNVMLVLNDQVDRTLIAFALGPAMLAYYALAALPTRAVRGVSFAVMAPVLPAASALAANGDLHRLRSLYLRVSRYLAIVDFGLCAGLAVLAPGLCALWLGAGYGRVAVTIAVICVGYSVWLVDQATVHPLWALERPEIRMRADMAFLAVHVPLSCLLLWKFGYFGTVAGTTSALVGTRMYVFVKGAAVLGVGVSHLFRASFLRPALCALGASLPVALADLTWFPSDPAAYLLQVALYGATYAALTWRIAVDRYDRGLIWRYLTVLPAWVRGLHALGRMNTVRGES